MDSQEIQTQEIARRPKSRGKRVGFLQVLSGEAAGSIVLLQEQDLEIGRQGSGLVIRDVGVSRRHARLEFSGGYRLIDLESTNGTIVNGESIQEAALQDGDTIELGRDCTLRFCWQTEQQLELAQKLARATTLDSATGFLKVEAFQRRLEQEIALTSRGGLNLSLLSVACSQSEECGRRLASLARREDELGLSGGDSFLMLLRNTDSTGALKFVERLQSSLSGLEPRIAGVSWLVGEDASRLLARLHSSQGLAFEEEPSLSGLRIYSLGGFEVYLGSQRLEQWHSRKVRFLLACIASRSRPVSADLLTEFLWAEDPLAAAGALQTAVSHLRKHLRPEGAPKNINYILRNPLGFYLNPELPHWHDLEQLEQTLEQLQRLQGASESYPWLRQLRQLYRGPYLEGCYQDWADTQRNQLEARVLHVLQSCLPGLTQAGKPEELLEASLFATRIDPCLQEAHGAAMQAYLALGRPEQALRHYQWAQKALLQELGVEPSLALLEQYHRARLALD
ncbi:FHA domain-containing protein [bacterium]|nr:FHA domain-containing protein [bacterium]